MHKNKTTRERTLVNFLQKNSTLSIETHQIHIIIVTAFLIQFYLHRKKILGSIVKYALSRRQKLNLRQKKLNLRQHLRWLQPNTDTN